MNKITDRLLDLEKELNTLIHACDFTIDHKHDNRLCDILYRISYIILRRRQDNFSEYDLDCISWGYSGRMYLKILNGFTAEKWLSYTSKVIIQDIKTHRELTNSEFIDVLAHPELEQPIIRMSTSSAMAICKESNDVFNRVYISTIPNLIKSLFDKFCKYRSCSEEYQNLYISILLSFSQDKLIYYNLSKELINYIQLLYNKIELELKKEIAITGLSIYNEAEIYEDNYLLQHLGGENEG